MASFRQSRLVALSALVVLPAALHGQTDYYNTDTRRPIRVEDAYPVERRAFELQLAPLRLERTRGFYAWGLEPEVEFGILPRTQLEVGFPVSLTDAPESQTQIGLAGIEVAGLYNLNVETSIPALAVAADVLLPAGGLGPRSAYPSVKAIATKTFSWMRLHANGQYTFGSALDTTTSGAVHLSRWFAGLAADKTFPLRSLLLTGEVVAEQPIAESENLEWSVATGMRYQYSPRWEVDAGVGIRLNADARPWFITVGSAYAVGLPWYPRR